MKLQTYDDIKVQLLRTTSRPSDLVKTAMNLTMNAEIESLGPCSRRSLEYLIQAQHTSLLEHVSMTFSILGVSRSLLAQLTRHRMSSFTSASQHYTDYRDMPMVVHPDHVDEFAEPFIDFSHAEGGVASALEIGIRDYVQMVANGVPIYEARQLLANAAAVNIIWTVNARSLLNFFQQRLCKRNVPEMQTVAAKVWSAVYDYWPEFADCCGPYCYPTGKCNQGRMTCGSPYTR